jgi:hypothetical protein
MGENALIPEGERVVAIFAYAREVTFGRDGKGFVYCPAAKAIAFA